MEAGLSKIGGLWRGDVKVKGVNEMDVQILSMHWTPVKPSWAKTRRGLKRTGKTTAATWAGLETCLPARRSLSENLLLVRLVSELPLH